MGLVELRDKLIDDAMASVSRFECRPHRLRGCLRGLEICRSLLNANDFTSEIDKRNDMELRLRVAVRDEKVTLDEYWEFRSATAAMEMVYRKMLEAYGCAGSDPLREGKGNVVKIRSFR